MQLHVAGCSYITADAVVKAVKTLVEHKGSLKQVRLNGVSHITKEHLDILKSILGVNHQPSFYSDWCSQTFNNSKDDGRPIDVDICPKCVSPRLVFDCTRQTCRLMKSRGGECRGCIFCIPRCGDCGGCVGLQELGEESACSHLLCLECWLRFPKCNMCNRPYCTKHKGSDLTGCSSKMMPAGFICQECQRHEDLLFDLQD
ncbi:hypothetical protein Taro_008653 [Colocasia esculenta]|uniref:Uncharacterized protein n=1 Tax=Colocasia esculenta TaxID=4460 RepID=A0A843TYT5_COLES|nr:hypothetical protein [Colocasia esculenta]